MQAFYAAVLKAIPEGAPEPCMHKDRLPYFERSYGILYAWETCQACGLNLNSRRLEQSHD